MSMWFMNRFFPLSAKLQVSNWKRARYLLMDPVTFQPKLVLAVTDEAVLLMRRSWYSRIALRSTSRGHRSYRPASLARIPGHAGETNMRYEVAQRSP